MATPVIIDLRNIYRSEELHRRGFAYASVGRPLDYPCFAKPEGTASIPQQRARSKRAVKGGTRERVT